MKIKIIYTIILLTISFYSVYGQERFEIWLNSSLDENPQEMIVNSINEYVGIVRKGTDPHVGFDCYLYKISSIGDTFSIPFVKQDTSLILTRLVEVNTNPIEYILCGTGYPNDSTYPYWFSYFAKLDNNLDVIWEKIYHLHNNHDYYYEPLFPQLLKKIDGTYLHACGMLTDQKMFLFEFDDNGDSLNYRFYEGDSTGTVSGLTYNHDSTRYLLHVNYCHLGPVPPHSQCIELDTCLNFIHLYQYPMWLSFDYTAKLLPSGDIAAACLYNDMPQQEKYIAAFKLDSVFNVIGECKITSPDTTNQRALKSLDFYYPSDIYFGGTHNFQIGIYVPEPSWYVIGRLDEDFNLKSELYIGGDATYDLATITATADSGVIITGTYYDYSTYSNQRDALIIKLSHEDLITGNCQNSNIDMSKAIIYPNPGIDNLHIRTTHTNSILYLYDNLGKLMLQYELNNHIDKIDVSKLKSGVYHYVITKDKKEICNGTWIKSKKS